MTIHRGSRYRVGAEYAALIPDRDASGSNNRGAAKTVRVQCNRILPDVPGIIEHRLKQGERLDHLAARYYRKPLNWWRICDANPDIINPLDFADDGPDATIHVTITYNNDKPALPWCELLKEIRSMQGVTSVRLSSRFKEFIKKEIKEKDRESMNISDAIWDYARKRCGEKVTCQTAIYEYILTITFNRNVTNSMAIRKEINDSSLGFNTEELEETSMIGMKIAIPRDFIG